MIRTSLSLDKIKENFKSLVSVCFYFFLPVVGIFVCFSKRERNTSTKVVLKKDVCKLWVV